MSAPLAAVLAGGRGRRMGAPKAGVLLGGKPLLALCLDAAAAAGVEAVVVAKAGSSLPEVGVPVWEEPAEPSHPLCGLVRALEAGRPVIALACDMPFVPPGLIARLAAMEGAAAARLSGRLEPFPGRYEPGALPLLRDALEREAPVRAALAELGPAVVDEDALRAFGDPARVLSSINTPEQLAAAERSLRG